MFDQHAAASMFDQHGVLDTLDEPEAHRIREALAATPTLNMMSSKGTTWCYLAFDDRQTWAPAAIAMHGFIFCSEHEENHVKIDVRKRFDEPLSSMHLRGDKGDIARFLNVPVIAFDDHASKLDRILAKAQPGSKGILICRERRPRRREAAKYRTSSDPSEWTMLIDEWWRNMYEGYVPDPPVEPPPANQPYPPRWTWA